MDWDSPINVSKVLNGDLLLPVRLLHAGLQEVFEVLDGVVSVLVHAPQQLLQTFLDPVSVGRRLVESSGVALHGFLLTLVNPGARIKSKEKSSSWKYLQNLFWMFDNFVDNNQNSP